MRCQLPPATQKPHRDEFRAYNLEWQFPATHLSMATNTGAPMSADFNPEPIDLTKPRKERMANTLEEQLIYCDAAMGEIGKRLQTRNPHEYLDTVAMSQMVNLARVSTQLASAIAGLDRDEEKSAGSIPQ